MEMQQMMEFLLNEMRADKDFLAKMEANKEELKANKEDFMAKLDADRRADKEEMKADIKSWREKIAAEMEAIKARTRAIRENMGTSHKEMVAVIEPGRNRETIACQEMEAYLKEEELTSVDVKPEAAEQREAPVQDATVMPVRNLKKKRRRLPERRRWPAKRWRHVWKKMS
jgi:hypothetical protein